MTIFERILVARQRGRAALQGRVLSPPPEWPLGPGPTGAEARDFWGDSLRGAKAPLFHGCSRIPAGERKAVPRLEPVVCVDVEAEDGSDFYRLVTAQSGLKLPTGEGSQNFRRHVGGAGFENA